MQFAKLNGVTLHYAVIDAAPEKPTIVFANSLGTDFRIWRDVIVRLVGDYKIITYDKRGHGLSDAPAAPYKMEDHSNDLIALLNHLDVSDAILCGVSVGGLIAQSVFHTKPDLVRALILCDTADKVGTDEMWNGRINAVETNGIASLSDMILRRWFAAPFCSDDNAAFAGYKNMLERTTVAGYSGTCSALRDANLTEKSPQINVPTIAIVGADDQTTTPELMRAFAKRIPNCFFEEIKDCGHLPCIEQPEMLSEIIKAFTQNLKS